MKNVVYLFPGQGSQKQGMLSELHEKYPVIRDTFAEASQILGYSMEDLCFLDSQSQLAQTEFTQPALLTCSTALWRLVQSMLPKRNSPANESPIFAGHSLGEYSALVASGVLEFGAALELVRKRGQAMQQAVPMGVGAMAALMGEAVGQAEDLCQEFSDPGSVVEIANENSLTQVVVSGHKEAVSRLSAAVKERKLGKAIALPVSAPFHSSLMQPAALEMAAALEKVAFGKSLDEAAGAAVIVANVDAKLYLTREYSRDLLVRQIVGRVRWTRSLQAIVAARQSQANEPDREICFVEVGPGNVLQGLVKKTLGENPQANPKILTFATDSEENLQQTVANIA